MSRVYLHALAAGVFLSFAGSAGAETRGLADTCAAKAEAEQLGCYREAAKTLQSQVDFFLNTPFAKPAEGETTANTYPAEAVRAYLAQISNRFSLASIGQPPRRLIVGLERFIKDQRRAAVSAPARATVAATTRTVAPAPAPVAPQPAPAYQLPASSLTLAPAPYVVQPAAPAYQAPAPQAEYTQPAPAQSGYVLPPYVAPSAFTPLPGYVPMR